MKGKRFKEEQIIVYLNGSKPKDVTDMDASEIGVARPRAYMQSPDNEKAAKRNP
jgi:hypothetical protein